MAGYRYCDGVTRRDALKVGALGAVGLSLADYLRLAEAGLISGKAAAKAAIFVNLSGGPSHMDTFDLKPNAPAEFRGEYKPIKTKAAGVEISEHLPKLAGVADKFAVVRGLSHSLAAHELGTKYMSTGNRPIASLEYPAYGSVVSRELPAPPDLPPYVAVPNTNHMAGFLGIAHGPFAINTTPRPNQPFSVRGITLAGGITVSDLEKRHQLLDRLDQRFAAEEKASQLLTGMDRFGERAREILRSTTARQAFDVAKEPASITGLFGADELSQSCLLAARLVEFGVRFVTVTSGGWDTHDRNFDRLKSTQLPKLDAAVAGLFQALAVKGLLDETLVIVAGEFGRTPKINKNAGRDHWPRAMFAVMGGGGIKGGQVIGESDDKGMGPKGTGYTPDQIGATIYKTLGIDFTKEYQTNSGRPITIVRDGKVIRELVG